MAFDLTAAGGYGTGSLDDYNLTDLTPQAINWCATATAVSDFQNATPTLTLTNVIATTDGDAWANVGFKVGTEVLIFADGKSDGSGLSNGDAKNFVGRWIVAKITASNVDATSGGTITVDKSLAVFNGFAFAGCDLKVVNIPHFKNLTIQDGASIIPGGNGFPVAFKCSETLTFNGGHIDLSGHGNSSQLRPALNQEDNGTLDTDKYSGWENSATKDRFVMNQGDGAAFIIANQINVANTASRIGNPNTQGVQFCRGASDSYHVPSGVTNIGGSTILICAGTFTNFTPKLIAKYRTGSATGGSGLARCYIASGTLLRNDEGLYAYDNISKPSVVTDTLKIKSFGDGSTGSYNGKLMLWSNFASVTAFSSNRKTLTVTNMTTDGAVAFEPGALVMVHAKNKDSTNTRFAGRFYLAKILGVNDNDITLDTGAAYNTFYNWLDSYYIQILTIPQFTNFTHTTPNSTSPKIPAWSDTKGYGGMFAIAVNNTCNLSGKTVGVQARGGGAAYGENGLNYIGNAQDYGRLPVGQGHGSVFILAKNLIMDSATRIGAIYSGAVSASGSYGGRGGDPNLNITTGVSGGGYRGATSTHSLYQVGGHIGGHGGGGFGGGGGYAGNIVNSHCGGYGSNGYFSGSVFGQNTAKQGAHIMIIADTITGFNQAAISTGGYGAQQTEWGSTPSQASPNETGGGHGSAGYGGGGAASHQANGRAYGGVGGYSGGGGGGDCTTCEDSYGAGGGAAGWAFIYCNNAVNQDTTDTVVD